MSQIKGRFLLHLKTDCVIVPGLLFTTYLFIQPLIPCIITFCCGDVTVSPDFSNNLSRYNTIVSNNYNRPNHSNKTQSCFKLKWSLKDSLGLGGIDKGNGLETGRGEIIIETIITGSFGQSLWWLIQDFLCGECDCIRVYSVEFWAHFAPQSYQLN